MSARGPIVLAAGGTGGHVFPARALAEELLRRKHRVALITDSRGGAFGGAAAAAEIHHISAGRIDGGVLGKMRGMALLAIGLIQARRILRRLAPGAVVGFGGYPSVPTMVAAVHAALPTMIHEQNAVLGRANRLVASRVSRIATAFAKVAGIGGDGGRVTLTGNPVCDDVVARRDVPYPDAADRLRLLIMGGSQGARTLGRTVPEAISRLPDALRARLDVSQQCREEDLEAARETYARCGVSAETATFFDDVPERLAAAHLVIARAGASTVAELTCVGRPAILVPYPFAADDHQTANARAIDAAGGGWLMTDAEVDADTLAERLTTLLAEPETLSRAATTARGIGQPDAARHLADAVEELMAPDGDTARQTNDTREEAI